MSDTANLRAWTDVVRRARLGRTVKAVAFAVATYADADGSRVFPGVARLSYECELSYNVIKDSLKALREAGLIKKVGRRGDADVYRLILATDLLERCVVPTPAQVELALSKLRAQKRGTYVPQADAVTEPADDGDEDLRPTAQAAENTEPDNLRPTARAADKEACGPPHGPQTESAAHRSNILQPTPWAATYQDHVTEETTHADTDLGTDCHPPREAASSPEDQISSEVVDIATRRCPHSNSARLNRAGLPRCEQCRAELAESANAGRVITAEQIKAAAGLVKVSSKNCASHGLPAATCSFCRRGLGGRP